MVITAKYAATCPACRGSILPGERVEWSKGSPARHTACVAGAASAPAPAAHQTPAAPSGRRTGCSCGSREDSYGQLIPSKYNCRSCRFDNE